MGLTQVSTDGVKNDAITKTKIPANQIEASELADNAVDTNAIANNAVTAGKLASGVQTTINNNADNRVITGSGTANTLNGESALTFDGTLLHLNSGNNGLPKLRLQHSGSGNDVFEITSGLTGVSNGGFGIYDVDASAYRFAIDSSGKLLLGNTSSFDSLAQLHIERTNNTVYSATTNTSNGINIYNNSATNGGFCGIQLGSSSSSGHYGSTVLQNVSVADGYSSDFVIKTRFSGSYAERLRVTSNGLTFNGDTAAANALDDYEEGTWTSTVYWNNSSTTGSSNNTSSVSGHYRKIGSLVFITLLLNPGSYNSGGDCVITKYSLPFTPSGISGLVMSMYGGWGNYGQWLGTGFHNYFARANTDGTGNVSVSSQTGGSGFWGHRSGYTGASGYVSGTYITA